MTRVKICGITNWDDARCAAEAGADFLGFVFYPKSPRYVAPERAAAIVRAVRGGFGRHLRCVGVFVDESAGQVRALLDEAELDLAQLHGSEPPDVLRALYPRAFKALRPRSLEEAAAALELYQGVFLADEALPQLLVDAYHPQQPGGTGIQVDVPLARPLAARCRLLLAGGLTPENVGAIVAQAQPWGVDVSSGVEAAPGVKDHARVQAFIRAARCGLNPGTESRL